MFHPELTQVWLIQKTMQVSCTPLIFTIFERTDAPPICSASFRCISYLFEQVKVHLEMIFCVTLTDRAVDTILSRHASTIILRITPCAVDRFTFASLGENLLKIALNSYGIKLVLEFRTQL